MPATSPTEGAISTPIATTAPTTSPARLPPRPTINRPSALALPTEETVLSTLRSGHPRLLLLAQDLERVRATLASDPAARAYGDRLRRTGEFWLRQAPPRLAPDARGNILPISNSVLDSVYPLALLHRLDGEARWFERARAELLAAAAFSDWHPDHFLDVAVMSHAFAIGYDWLYDALPAGDRETIRAALVEKGLRPALAAYRSREWWTRDPYNWNLVCNGAIAIAALAVADTEPALARSLLAQALSNLPYALATYAPDGAWPEGPTYWSFASHYVVESFAAIESALGTDFGLGSLPGLAETGRFRLHIVGPTGLPFNFADADEGTIGDEPSLFWLADRYDQPLLAWAGREAALGRLGRGGHTGSRALDLIWYDAGGSIQDLARIPLDVRFSAANLAYFRSAWTDREALYVGFKAGDNKVNHSHLELGSFALDALGQRWALELGINQLEYALPDYFGKLRFTYYRTRTEGHNTLTLDGQNQDERAVAPLERFASGRDAAYAIADLTAAYRPSGARRVRRGIGLVDRRSRVVVRDEIDASRPVEIAWTMHTPAQIVANDDRATLSLAGTTLTARVIEPPGARFASEAVVIPPPQRPADDVRRLVIRLPRTASARISVLLTPGTRDDAPAVRPLDEWPTAGPLV